MSTKDTRPDNMSNSSETPEGRQSETPGELGTPLGELGNQGELGTPGELGTTGELGSQGELGNLCEIDPADQQSGEICKPIKHDNEDKVNM